MKGVQCYELFGGIALKNHAFSFFISVPLQSGQLCSDMFCDNFAMDATALNELEILLRML